MSQTPEISQPDPSVRPRRSVTPRAVLIGIAMGIVTAALVPINDYLLGNGFIVGSYLPVGVIFPMIVLCAIFNPLLRRFIPGLAFNRGELATVLGVLLASTMVMSQGGLRTLLPTLVALPWQASLVPVFEPFLKSLELPAWLFPAELSAEAANDPVVRDFFTRTPPDQAIPFSRWIVPLLGWSPLLIGLMLMFAGIGLVMQRQWQVNERLPFPLVTVYNSLIADPAPGRFFNHLLGCRLLWITALSVVVIQSSDLLSDYFPRSIPDISLRAELWKFFADSSLRFLPAHFQSVPIIFTFVGIAYFIHARVTLSICFFVFVYGIAQVLLAVQGRTFTFEQGSYQAMGAGLTYSAATLFLARHWLVRVARVACGRPASPADRSELGMERRAFWCALIGALLVLTWLLYFGIRPHIALLLMINILLVHYITARVVAETGIPFYRLQADTGMLSTLTPSSWYAPRDALGVGLGSMFGTYTARLSSMVIVQHVAGIMGVGRRDQDPAIEEGAPRRKFLAAVVVALPVIFVVAVAAQLWTSYRFDTQIAADAAGIELDSVSFSSWPRGNFVDIPMQIAEDRVPERSFYPSRNLAFGAMVMLGLVILAARVNWWPIAPIGFLVCHSWFMQVAWASLLIGCCAKMLLLRFGGPQLLERAKPVFVGLVLGEAINLGIWLTATILLAAAGEPFFRILILPR